MDPPAGTRSVSEIPQALGSLAAALDFGFAAHRHCYRPHVDLGRPTETMRFEKD